MAKTPLGVWGIDLGQCALKALRVENIDGQVTATAFDYVEHPKILSQPDADPDQLTREALEKFLSRNSIKGDLVAISIPGQSGLARFVKLPPVEEKKIPDIVRFEAKQQIPFNLEEVVWDYQKLGSGVVTDGFAMETEIGLFAIKRETVNRYLQHFKDVNVEVHVVQMAPLALCNFVSYDLLEKAEEEGEEAEPGKKRCIVALDIGADNSNLVITDGQRIIWQRPIPLGGNHFTRALTKDMKLTFAKAEHLKRNATKSPELKQILSSLKPVLNDFVGEVQRSLGYFTNTHRDSSIQYMMGLGSAFRLPGLQKFLGEKLQLDVRKLQKIERLQGDEVVNAPAYTENVLSFAVAYGLALQGLKMARLHTNLLPQDIQVERMIRAKKPWAVTAAAVLLLSTSALGIGYAMQHRAVAHPKVDTAMKQGKGIVETANSFKTKVENVRKQIDTDREAVRSVVLGQDERINWIEFNKIVSEALPKADGSNLTTEARQLFLKPEALRAYQQFKDQQKGKAGGGQSQSDEEKWRNDLIQANVESVYCVYCDNLGEFFKNVKDVVIQNDLKDFNASALNAPPPPSEGKKAKGWVVEVRGYTYHRDGLNFVWKGVKDTLAQSLEALETTTKTGAGADAPKADTPVADDKPKEDKDRILKRVSHVVLFAYYPVTNPDPTQFVLINSSALDSLLGTGSGGGGYGQAAGALSSKFMKMGGMGGGQAPGAGGGDAAPTAPSGGTTGGATARNWSPLIPSSLEGGSGGSTGPSNSGGAASANKFGAMMGGPKMMRDMGAGGPMGPPLPLNRGNVPQPEENRSSKAKHTRTEFIILFIWNEWTPSDDLRKDTSGSPN